MPAVLPLHLRRPAAVAVVAIAAALAAAILPGAAQAAACGPALTVVGQKVTGSDCVTAGNGSVTITDPKFGTSGGVNITGVGGAASTIGSLEGYALGVAKRHTDAFVGRTTVVNNVYPFNGQRNAIQASNILNVEAAGPVGNIIATGDIGNVSANSGDRRSGSAILSRRTRQ